MSQTDEERSRRKKKKRLPAGLTAQDREAVDYQRRARVIGRLIAQGKLPRSCYPAAPRLF